MGCVPPKIMMTLFAFLVGLLLATWVGLCIAFCLRKPFKAGNAGKSGVCAYSEGDEIVMVMKDDKGCPQYFYGTFQLDKSRISNIKLSNKDCEPNTFRIEDKQGGEDSQKASVSYDTDNKCPTDGTNNSSPSGASSKPQVGSNTNYRSQDERCSSKESGTPNSVADFSCVCVNVANTSCCKAGIFTPVRQSPCSSIDEHASDRSKETDFNNCCLQCSDSYGSGSACLKSGTLESEMQTYTFTDVPQYMNKIDLKVLDNSKPKTGVSEIKTSKKQVKLSSAGTQRNKVKVKRPK